MTPSACWLGLLQRDASAAHIAHAQLASALRNARAEQASDPSEREASVPSQGYRSAIAWGWEKYDLELSELGSRHGRHTQPALAAYEDLGRLIAEAQAVPELLEVPTEIVKLLAQAHEEYELTLLGAPSQEDEVIAYELLRESLVEMERAYGRKVAEEAAAAAEAAARKRARLLSQLRIGVGASVGIVVLVVWALIGKSRAQRIAPLVTLPGAHVIYYLTPLSFDAYAGACTEADAGGDASETMLASFDATSDAIVLKVGSRLLELRRRNAGTWDQMLDPRLLSEGLGAEDDVATDAAGVVLVVDRASGRLRQVTSEGSLQELSPRLPASTIPGPYGLAPSSQPGVAYLYGSQHVLTLGDEGSAAALSIEFDQPAIERLVETVDGLYAVLREDPDGTRKIVHLQSSGVSAVIAFPEIVSLASPEDRRELFFSTPDTVYAMAGKTAVPLTRDLGGRLRWRNGILFVFDCRRHFFVGIDDLPAALGLP
jgi:hypothetical protein